MTYIILNAYYTTYPCFRKHVDGVYTYSNTVTTCNELLDLILVTVPKYIQDGENPYSSPLRSALRGVSRPVSESSRCLTALHRL